jgi:hypothetical protein
MVSNFCKNIETYFLVPDRFDDITEEEIVNTVKEAMLPDDKFMQLCDVVKPLMDGIEDQHSCPK